MSIGAAAFQPSDSTSVYVINGGGDAPSDGYLYRHGGLVDSWVAPLELPAGAEIFEVCVYGFDNALLPGLAVHLEAVKLEFEGQPGAGQAVWPVVVLDIQSPPYGRACSPPGSYVFRQKADLDDDGNVEDLAHRIRVRILKGDGTAGLGGVRIGWRRQVSPAPMSASFADVPAGTTLHPFVEALHASGLTGGCGDGTNYCPDDPVTRGQIAVLLSKALGLHWPD
jgi:hypothetical protein